MERIKELYEETKNVIKIRDIYTKKLSERRKELDRDDPESGTFLHYVDLEEVFEKGQDGGD